MIYDLPPDLRGTPQQQLGQIHNYLVRLARKSQQESGSGNGSVVTGITLSGDQMRRESSSGKSGTITLKDIQDLQKKAEALRSLIIKTADQTYTESVGASERIMQTLYLSQSDFGTYQEAIYTRIEETARQIRESYDYEALVNSVNDIEDYLNVVHGEIRRGYVPNPVSGETPVTFGIVIATKNVFSASEQTWTPDGEEFSYSEIKSDERFGIYTADGWEYWHGGLKQWWFDAVDGSLHARNIVIENFLQLGAWRHVNDGDDYGIKNLGV